MIFISRLAAASIAVLVFLAAAPADNNPATANSDPNAPVQVARSAPISTTRWYDSQNPPDGLPVDPAEPGVTISQFRCTAHVSGAIIDQTQHDKDVVAIVRVDRVHIQLDLAIDEWIATPPTRGIVAHEDGHRIISEHFYTHADIPAASIGQQTLGRTFSAVGATVTIAADNAFSDAAKQIAQQYQNGVYVPCEQAQQAYDKITAHGTNDVDEMDAIEWALKQVKQP